LQYKMADKKSKKRRKGDEDQNPTKDETEVAKYLRFNLPTKKATLFGEKAVYFSGSNAVDFLMDSKWASGKGKSSIEFTHRDSVADYLRRMLNCQLFSRVHVIKTEKKVKKKDEPDKKSEEKAIEEKKSENKKDTKSPKEPNSPKAKKEGKEARKIKKKVKVTLEVNDIQEFFDSDEEFYVWIFDPISWKTFILGILLVLGVVIVCLFPLWPESVRDYSWYLSVAGAIFVGGILILAILRYIIYGLLWLGTMGKLHFWLLPNLTAECGFFESFVPAYQYTVKKEEKEEDKSIDGDDKDKAKESLENEDESEKSENGDWVKVKKDDAEEDGVQEEVLS